MQTKNRENWNPKILFIFWLDEENSFANQRKLVNGKKLLKVRFLKEKKKTKNEKNIINLLLTIKKLKRREEAVNDKGAKE